MEKKKNGEFYAMLGLNKECTTTELRKSYKKLAPIRVNIPSFAFTLLINWVVLLQFGFCFQFVHLIWIQYMCGLVYEVKQCNEVSNPKLNRCLILLLNPKFEKAIIESCSFLFLSLIIVE